MTDVGVDKCPSARGFIRAESNNPLAASRYEGSPPWWDARARSSGHCQSHERRPGLLDVWRRRILRLCGDLILWNLPLTNTAGGCSPGRHVLREPQFVRYGPLHECEQFMCVHPSDGYRLRGVSLYSRHDHGRRRDRDLRGHCRQHHQTLAHPPGHQRNRPSDRGALLRRGSEGPASRIPGEFEGTSPRSLRRRFRGLPRTRMEDPRRARRDFPGVAEDPSRATRRPPGQTRNRPSAEPAQRPWRSPRARAAKDPLGGSQANSKGLPRGRPSTLFEASGGPRATPENDPRRSRPSDRGALLGRGSEGPLGGSQASSKGLPRGRRTPFPSDPESDPAATRPDPKPTLGGAGRAPVARFPGETRKRTPAEPAQSLWRGPPRRNTS
jgi:hypothetical protein